MYKRKKVKMTKQEKINKLTKQIEELTEELEELSKNKEVKCYGDKIVSGDSFEYIGSAGIIGCSRWNRLSDSIEYRKFHNTFKQKSLTQEDLNNQKIINRILQLSKKFNPEGWHYNMNRGEGYEVSFNKNTGSWGYWGLDTDMIIPLPKFANKEAAQKVADDLNAKGYKL